MKVYSCETGTYAPIYLHGELGNSLKGAYGVLQGTLTSRISIQFSCQNVVSEVLSLATKQGFQWLGQKIAGHHLGLLGYSKVSHMAMGAYIWITETLFQSG